MNRQTLNKCHPLWLTGHFCMFQCCDHLHKATSTFPTEWAAPRDASKLVSTYGQPTFMSQCNPVRLSRRQSETSIVRSDHNYILCVESIYCAAIKSADDTQATVSRHADLSSQSWTAGHDPIGKMIESWRTCSFRTSLSFIAMLVRFSWQIPLRKSVGEICQPSLRKILRGQIA